jgi:hypothetical protein
MPLRESLQRWSRMALWLGLLGGVAALVGLCLDPAAFARAWLLAFVAWVGLPLGALGFRMLHGLCGGDWGRAVGGVLDAMLRTMPVMVVLFVPLLFGISALYPWTRADFAMQPELARKAVYLNGVGFALRGLGCLIGWAVLGRLVVRARAGRRGAICAVGLIVYTLSGTLAALDWVMSLDPQWTSRVFGILFLVGQALAAFAFAVALVAWSASRPDAAWRPEPKTLRDLGNLLQAFLLLWAYLEFMQLLVIWNGNLPHSIPWYLARSGGIWLVVSVALGVLHFGVPFLLLLFRANKEHPRRLCWIASWLVLMRLLADGWTVLPAFGAGVHWLDVAVPLAMGGVVLALIFRALPSRLPDALALVPEVRP